MGVGKSMKTFISAMTEQTGMGGYGSKIKSTPMGPFKWNDLTQLWENVNNGMVMNNVSFQDMFMMNYDTIGGDTINNIIEVVYDWGVLNYSFADTTVSTTIFARNESATENISQGKVIIPNGNITFRGFVTYTITGGKQFDSIQISKTIGGTGGPLVNQNLLATQGVTASAGDHIRIRATANGQTGGWTLGNTGTLEIVSLSQGGITLDAIPFVYGVSEPEPP
jgi:hypothetical protein